MNFAIPRSFLPVVALAASLVVPAHPGAQEQPNLPLDRLTVPAERLANVCRLTPSDRNVDGGRLQGGLWGGLPISTNPWHGTDRKTIAAIRERIAAAPEVPDGPPLSRGELARFQAQLTDDVEEAYAAVYGEDAASRVIVNAVRFRATSVPGAPKSQPSTTLRIVRDRTVIAIAGSENPCSEAVRAYISFITAR